jgi:hypothetical protein
MTSSNLEMRMRRRMRPYLPGSNVFSKTGTTLVRWPFK